MLEGKVQFDSAANYRFELELITWEQVFFVQPIKLLTSILAYYDICC